MSSNNEIEIRECDTVELLEGCVDLQRSVFALPEIEISPVRHFIVTMHAGGFTLGAFHGNRLIGFCLSVPAILDGERALYSHMTAVTGEFQSSGIGARLKWAQRERALSQGTRLIKWTFQPEKARNAYFNLEKLGAEVRQYMPNFYGADYGSTENGIAIESDRLFAVWKLDSEKTEALAAGMSFVGDREPVSKITVPYDWERLLETDRTLAAKEQQRIRKQFLRNFEKGLVCTGFRKDPEKPGYLFFA